jgi:hypothetical protein
MVAWAPSGEATIVGGVGPEQGLVQFPFWSLQPPCTRTPAGRVTDSTYEPPAT